MLLKIEALTKHLRQKIYPIYFLYGDSPYLFNEAATFIKKAWSNQYPESEYSIIDINAAADWNHLKEATESYSLFASQRLLDIRYDKKTLEAAGKNFLTSYLGKMDQDNLLLFRVPNLPKKQLDWLINRPDVVAIQIKDLSGLAMQQWITRELQKKELLFEPEIPKLIHQHTEGNMLAAAQTIEKLALITDKNTSVHLNALKEQLINQCDFELYELADACLNKEAGKVVQLLDYARHSKAEPSLILWILSNEIRLMLQLNGLLQQAIPLATALSQLRIWPQKGNLYQNSIKALGEKKLIKLLSFCKTIDERIKSNQNYQIWQSLEQVALSISLNKEVGALV